MGPYYIGSEDLRTDWETSFSPQVVRVLNQHSLKTETHTPWTPSILALLCF